MGIFHFPRDCSEMDSFVAEKTIRTLTNTVMQSFSGRVCSTVSEWYAHEAAAICIGWRQTTSTYVDL